MNTLTHIIGIGGNIHQPNPRLPAYIVPSLVNDRVSQILLTSSLDSAQKFSGDDYTSEKIGFETYQKLQLLQDFRASFFSQSANLTVNIEEESNNFKNEDWLRLWEEVEKVLAESEREEVNLFFTRINKTSSIKEARNYGVRHAFWFYDLSFQDRETTGFETIGGPSEQVFNIIRNATLRIDETILYGIFGRHVYKHDISKSITPSRSRVVPYGEATRKSGKKQLSIEYIEEGGNIHDHYKGRHQQKSGLDRDINLIHSVVNPDDYQDFYHDFLRRYHADSLAK